MRENLIILSYPATLLVAWREALQARLQKMWLQQHVGGWNEAPKYPTPIWMKLGVLRTSSPNKKPNTLISSYAI